SAEKLKYYFSLLTFPVIYWLCRELFALPLVGWLAMALYGISPAMLKFATFVRPYSLLLLLSLLSSAIFLRSLKHSTKLGWMLYAATTAVGLYTHLLMGLVAIAHGIYLLIVEKFRLTELVKRFFLSAIAAGVIALPWLWIVWQSLPTVRETTKWLAKPIPALELIHWWAKNFNQGFAAWHFQYESIFFWAIAPLLALIGWAFYVLIRRTPWRTWSFILILMGTSFLPFLLADLLLGGKRTTAQRFFLVCYVCMDIVIAYWLASNLAATIKERGQHQFWTFLTVLLLGVGAISGAAGAWGETWWGHSEFDKAIAPIVAQTSRPLVINFCDYCGFYDKVYFPLTFNPETHVLFINDANSFFLPPGFSNIFLFMFSPSSKTTYLSELEQQSIDYQLAYYFIDTSTQFEVALYRVNLQPN
ncbi:MAG: hypothetical protein HC890_10495, partial [Chloroflexaceae bacterium]|nr:hypothetical protein [Chloroflexaceae bacterium]